MTDYLFRLEVPADKRSFTVAEALEATGEAIHPDYGSNLPVRILSIDKVEIFRDRTGRPHALEEADWRVLRVIWSRMDEPEFPMTLAQWQTYLDAFNSSPNKPEGWGLSALQSDPEMQSALKRAVAYQDHRDILKRAVNAGEITLRNPVTGAVSELGWIGDADSWLLTVEQFKALCDRLAIEVVTTDSRPTFQTLPRPLEIPAALRRLPPLTEILTQADFAASSGTATARAGEYIAYLEDIMRRQAAGLFTLAEAAQVLADARPGADVRGILKKMHKAYREGKLHIRDPGDLLPKVIADFHRDYWDLVKVSDIDAWLTQDGAGYLFPPAADAETPGPAAPPARARFVIEARPSGVPAELLALPADEVVAFEHWKAQTNGPRVRTECSAYLAGQLKADIQDRIDRQREGWFTASEAAHIVARERPGSDEYDVERRILAAVTDGDLHAHQAESRLRLGKDGAGRAEQVRPAIDLLKATELDAWLRASAGYGFPPAAGAESPLVPAAAPETPKQRRARLLAMFDAESAAGREHGALARITEVEKRTRPTADRSNIGKDIKKAREERDAERRGGALARLLG